MDATWLIARGDLALPAELIDRARAGTDGRWKRDGNRNGAHTTAHAPPELRAAIASTAETLLGCILRPFLLPASLTNIRRLSVGAFRAEHRGPGAGPRSHVHRCSDAERPNRVRRRNPRTANRPRAPDPPRPRRGDHLPIRNPPRGESSHPRRTPHCRRIVPVLPARDEYHDGRGDRADGRTAPQVFGPAAPPTELEAGGTNPVLRLRLREPFVDQLLDQTGPRERL